MTISFNQKVKLFAAAIAAHFAHKPASQPAHCGNIKALLLHLCDFDEQQCRWILQWLAYPLKNPGARMDQGLIINGSEGTGKRLFFERVMVPLYEGDACAIGPAMLLAKVNAWANYGRLVVVTGAVTTRTLTQAKGYMTSGSLIIESKDEKPRERANHLNFVFLSGSVDFLRSDIGDRRFVVVEAPPPMRREFYRAIAYEIDNGGVAAFRDHLMRDVDLTGFNEHTRPPARVASPKARQAA